MFSLSLNFTVRNKLYGNLLFFNHLSKDNTLASEMIKQIYTEIELFHVIGYLMLLQMFVSTANFHC